MVPMPGLRETDMKMLQELLDENELSELQREMLTSMLDSLDTWQILSQSQRKVVQDIHARFHPVYENLVSEGKVPRGKEVLTPPVLFQNLPLKPPGRVCVTRTIEIEEEEVREWTCPKCGRHEAYFYPDEVMHCGHEAVGRPGCGATFPATEYEAQSVVLYKQDDLLSAIYGLLMEEAKRRGHECIVFGALPGDEMTYTSGSVADMAGQPFYWVPSKSGDRILREPEK